MTVESSVKRVFILAAVFLACTAVLPPAMVARTVQVPEVRIARLHYEGGGDWYCDPSSLPNWLALFRSRSGIPTPETDVVVTLDS